MNKFKNDPVFHVGPIIRREQPYTEMSISERRRLLNKILIFFTITPILHKEFMYKKKIFDRDEGKMIMRISKDIYSFLVQQHDYFSSFDMINIYYDKGQQVVRKALMQSFGIASYNVFFKKDVKNADYRLAQVADYITSIYLTDIKMNNGELSKSEQRFFDNKVIFRRVYLKSLKKKEI